MNLQELQAARAQKIYEYGEAAYELNLLQQRTNILQHQQHQIVLVLQNLEEEIDNFEKNNVKDLDNSEK